MINIVTRKILSRYSPIGIDIGSAQIKMIQFRQRRGRVNLHCQAISPTPAEVFEEGAINKPDLLIKALKRLKDKKRWHKNRANLCLGPRAFYLRKVRLPLMTEKERHKAMFWEVEKHFPLAAKEAVFDFCPAGSLTENGEQSGDYLLAAVAKDTADAYTAAAAGAGFLSASLEILPLTLFRSLQNSPRVLGGSQKQERILGNRSALRVLLDIGFRDSSIVISRGSLYLYYRNIKTGIDHFCRTLLQSGCVNYRSAYQRVFENGPLESRGLLTAADHFSAKVGQSLAYWADQTECPSSALYSLEFCGGGAFIPGLASCIEQKLALKRCLYNPLAPVTGSGPGKQPEGRREAALYPAAHGLALRGWLK